MNITLVHPAGSNWVPGQTDFTPIANRMAPLGLLSMAAWLRERHHRVHVYDCLAWDRPRPQPAVVRDILDRQPDLVGFSATTSGFLDGYGLAEASVGVSTWIPGRPVRVDAAEVARDIVGAERVDEAARPMMAAEDFAYLLEARPGAYVFIGNGVSELIDLTLRALLNPGDEVLIPSPDYPLWTAAVTLPTACGAAPHAAPTSPTTASVVLRAAFAS